MQIKVTNLNLVDEKLSALGDCLKRTNSGSISQLCSDWWELTDEDEYAIVAFIRATADT